MIYPNFDIAYISLLRELKTEGIYLPSVSDPFSVGSGFGNEDRKTIEIIGKSFCIRNPRDKLSFSRNRKINLAFAVANALWTAAGRDDLNFIAYYNSAGNKFSDDGKTLSGAHGKRIFNSQGIDQFRAVIEKLKQDKASRRTYISVYQPVDNFRHSKDIPCLAGIQPLVRDNKVNLICFMRSQSAAFIMPYDVFSFAFLQEVLSVELGLELGVYYHFCSSFHVYENEFDILDRIIDEDYKSVQQPPKMPKDIDALSSVADVLISEAELRKINNQLDFDAFIEKLNFSPFWKDLFLILAKQIAKTNGFIFSHLGKIHNYYQPFLKD